MNGRANRRPSLAMGALAVASVRISLKVVGFRRTISAVRHLSRPRRAVRAPGPDEAALAAAAVRAVVTAAAFLPGRALCLEQSVGLFLLLRRSGVPARLRMGVQPLPFSAHAWVELAGRPLNERPEVLQRLIPLPDPVD